MLDVTRCAQQASAVAIVSIVPSAIMHMVSRHEKSPTIDHYLPTRHTYTPHQVRTCACTLRSWVRNAHRMRGRGSQSPTLGTILYADAAGQEPVQGAPNPQTRTQSPPSPTASTLWQIRVTHQLHATRQRHDCAARPFHCNTAALQGIATGIKSEGQAKRALDMPWFGQSGNSEQ